MIITHLKRGKFIDREDYLGLYTFISKNIDELLSNKDIDIKAKDIITKSEFYKRLSKGLLFIDTNVNIDDVIIDPNLIKMDLETLTKLYVDLYTMLDSFITRDSTLHIKLKLLMDKFMLECENCDCDVEILKNDVCKKNETYYSIFLKHVNGFFNCYSNN